MASKHEPLPPLEKESAMDYAQHEQTYSGFVTAVKYGVLATAVLVIILYFAIRP
ncbi:aa3-type cytochrome c oxidase subunit IV [uncultured Devosia sp.]|uniref:aa3-type cytochrome c oxidase subunit IV n=1 Tax=uncultured Devosia sp. TaxID=211434 RepID=UPI0035CBCE13